MLFEVWYLGVRDVEFTDQFENWWNTLSVEDQHGIDAAVRVLEERGPGLGRPLVDTVEGSRHANMKELRVGTIRILVRVRPQKGGDPAARRRQARPLVGVLHPDHPSRRPAVRRAPQAA
jgi:mRNA-degrading endonuclease RelE of RelBE toxin-antitoxin system